MVDFPDDELDLEDNLISSPRCLAIRTSIEHSSVVNSSAIHLGRELAGIGTIRQFITQGHQAHQAHQSLVLRGLNHQICSMDRD